MINCQRYNQCNSKCGVYYVGPVMVRVLFAHQITSVIGSKRYVQRVFPFTHECSVFALPATFVNRLIKIVVVVTKDMMKQPEICCDACMQCVDEFK